MQSHVSDEILQCAEHACTLQHCHKMQRRQAQPGRVAKSCGRRLLAVNTVTCTLEPRALQAGGIAMVLVNTPLTANNQVIGAYLVPTVHLTLSARDALVNYTLTAGATATVGENFGIQAPAPSAADFSSRGPTNAAVGDLLKPVRMYPHANLCVRVCTYQDKCLTPSRPVCTCFALMYAVGRASSHSVCMRNDSRSR